MYYSLNCCDFTITDKWEEVIPYWRELATEVEGFNLEERLSILDKPSGLTNVYLTTDYWNNETKEVDLTGTTNEEAIKKILKFYTDETHRSLVGDHIFFEGFDVIDGKTVISLGS